MKYVIILGDGMADEPIGKLGNRTPLQVADKPSIDRVARDGVCGTLVTVPDGFTPGSEIANLGILGYDVTEVYEGRGSLEAASMGVPINDGEVAMRCNIICVENGRIKNHSAGHISTVEADELIKALNKELGNEQVSFYTGVSYRHLLKIKGGDKRVKCTPPHDVPGALIETVMPVAEVEESITTRNLLVDLMNRSRQILENHPINKKRIAEGKDPANMIWPWSLGYKPSMKPLKDLYGVNQGAVISAVDLIKGIGSYADLEVINVDGATGLFNTNYEGKAQAAINALNNGADFVFVHVEASDEAGHEGDVDLKIKTIEYLDHRIVKPILEAIDKSDDDIAIAVLPDHPTPCAVKTHTSAPVPFAILKPRQKADFVDKFDEDSCAKGNYKLEHPTDFMKLFLSRD